MKEKNIIKTQKKLNENRLQSLKDIDSCLKKCSHEIDTLRHKNEYSVNQISDSLVDELDSECNNLKERFKVLENIDDGHFEEVRNNFKMKTEELLKKCEEALF